MIGIDNESELLAEHQAAAQAVKDAEEAKRQAEYRARNEAEHAQRLARERPHLLEILKHIPADIAPAGLRDGKIFLGTFDTSYDLSFQEHYTSTSSWRSVRTSKWKFITGGYGDRKSWMPLKAGGYNYRAIAKELVEHYESRKRQDQSRSNQLTNEAVVAQVKQRMNLARYDYKLSASSNSEKPVFVKFEFSRSMTAEEAEALIIMLAPLKVFSHNND